MKLKFLIDNALSPIFSKQLQAHGFDVIHVRDIHMEKCSDDEIPDFAQKENRIVGCGTFSYQVVRWNLSRLIINIILPRGTEKWWLGGLGDKEVPKSPQLIRFSRREAAYKTMLGGFHHA